MIQYFSYIMLILYIHYHIFLTTTAAAAAAAFSFMFNFQIFQGSLPARHVPPKGSQRRIFLACWYENFYRLFLSPSQHCQSIEGISYHICYVLWSFLHNVRMSLHLHVHIFSNQIMPFDVEMICWPTRNFFKEQAGLSAWARPMGTFFVFTMCMLRLFDLELWNVAW